VFDQLLLLVVDVHESVVFFLVAVVLVLGDAMVFQLALVDLHHLVAQVAIRRGHYQAFIVVFLLLLVLQLVVVVVLVYCRQYALRLLFNVYFFLYFRRDLLLLLEDGLH